MFILILYRYMKTICIVKILSPFKKLISYRKWYLYYYNYNWNSSNNQPTNQSNCKCTKSRKLKWIKSFWQYFFFVLKKGHTIIILYYLFGWLITWIMKWFCFVKRIIRDIKSLLIYMKWRWRPCIVLICIIRIYIPINNLPIHFMGCPWIIWRFVKIFIDLIVSLPSIIAMISWVKCINACNLKLEGKIKNMTNTISK